MHQSWIARASFWVIVFTTLALLVTGCGKMKKMVGITQEDEDEEYPAEVSQETVVIDNKTFVRSRNPYYLIYPEQPEYIYAEKGTEFEGLQVSLAKSVAKYISKEKGKAGTGIPPEKLQEMVRQEVERILREQGQGGVLYASRVKSTSPYTGRAVAVIPALLETPKGYDGINLTLANGLRAELQRQKDLTVINEEATKEALTKVTGSKLAARHNIQALGDALGVQGIIITQVIPPGTRDSSGYLVMEVYETFLGSQVKALPEASPPGALTIDAAYTAVRKDAGLLADQIRGLDWFGRIEFMKEGKVFLNVGNNSGLKPGSLLAVVQPGKEIINPQTQASLGYTADIIQGELKVTDVLGNNGAAATIVTGGPFKPNEKVKGR